MYLYCICVSPIDIFALSIPRSLGVAEAPVCRGLKATWPVESKAHHPFWDTLMLTHHEVIIEIHCIEYIYIYIPPCLTHLIDTYQMKTLNPKTSPTLRRTCMVWRVGQGQAYLSTTVAVWGFYSILAVWTLLGFICVLLWHQGQAYVWTPVAIWGFSFLVSSVLFSVMFWWHAHVVLLWDMPAVFCILYLSLYQSRVLTGTWHSPGFVGDSQLLPSIVSCFPTYKNTRNHELE